MISGRISSIFGGLMSQINFQLNSRKTAQTTIVVTGIGVVSPYSIGVEALHNGLLAGQNCLLPSHGIFPGFEGSTAPCSYLPPLPSSSHYSRSDHLAMIAAEESVAGFDRASA